MCASCDDLQKAHYYISTNMLFAIDVDNTTYTTFQAVPDNCQKFVCSASLTGEALRFVENELRIKKPIQVRGAVISKRFEKQFDNMRLGFDMVEKVSHLMRN